MFIPYGKQSIDNEDISSVSEALKADWITTGPKVEEFERNLAAYVGARSAVAVNSGTSALDIAVASLELKPGSEIITTPFTFVADANCILYNQHNPVFADIDSKTYNIDPDQIEKKITKKTKAIIYVDYAGQPCDIDKIKQIAKQHNLYLIEDACHAIGAKYKGKNVGSQADMTIFSFHPVKHITTGEGGAITTNSQELDMRLRMLRNHGMDKSVHERFGKNAGYEYDIKLLGRNYRITDFQCALGISQLKKLDVFLNKRKDVAKYYNSMLSNLEGIILPFVKADVDHAWHLYPILLPNKQKRDEFFAFMRKNGVGVNVHYSPIYSFSLYEQFHYKKPDFPVTENISQRVISLPMYSGITKEELDTVVGLTKRFVLGV